MRLHLRTTVQGSLLAVSIWVIDAIIDMIVFYDKSFWGVLIYDVPPHEVYSRLIIIALFLTFTFLLSIQMKKLTETSDLITERNKELSFIYQFNNDLQESTELDVICENLINNLQNSMHHPDIAVPVIELFGKDYRHENYTDTLNHYLSSDILLDNKKVGAIHVYYTKNKDFLIPEEQNLLNGLTKTFSNWLKQRRYKTKILESESKFRALFENVNVGIGLYRIITDENGTPVDFVFLDVNSKYENMTNLDAEDIIGWRGSEIVPNIENAWIHRFGKVALNGISIDFVDYSDHLKKYWEVKAFPPKPGQFAIVLTDITEQKRINDELLNSKTMLNNVLNTIPVRVFWKNITGRYMGCNQLFAEDAGLNSPEELVGKTDYDFFAKENAEIYRQDDREVLDNGEAKLDYHEPLIKPDGTKILRNITKIPLRNNSNKIIGVLGTYSDITQIYEIENALVENEKKLNTLFESMIEMVVSHQLIMDDDGQPVNYMITDCNHAFSDVTGIKKEEAVGKLATEVYGTPEPPYLKEFSKVALTGKTFQYETYFDPMDKHFLISVVSPEKGQFATITMDITKIKEYQETLYAKNKELENYLYVASHDLRSPLVNIQGFSKRLETITEKIAKIIETESNPETKKQQLNRIIDNELPKTLGFIFSGVSKMDKLINGLLQLSRTGRSLMNIQQVNMEQLIRNILQTFNFQLEKIEATVNISTLKPCYGDPDLLNQLFSNIIGNAIKYRDKERKLKIDISSRVMSKRVVYSISDNGSGISPRHIDKIWDIFFRDNADQKEGGDGIGLSLVKRIVDKHKGNIRVESQLDIGTTFFIELPKNKFSLQGTGGQSEKL